MIGTGPASELPLRFVREIVFNNLAIALGHPIGVRSRRAHITLLDRTRSGRGARPEPELDEAAPPDCSPDSVGERESVMVLCC